MLGIRLLSIEKVAGARLLHNLRPRVAAEITESIRTVNDGIDFCNFRIAQYKVAVCCVCVCVCVESDLELGLEGPTNKGLVLGTTGREFSRSSRQFDESETVRTVKLAVKQVKGKKIDASRRDCCWLFWCQFVLLAASLAAKATSASPCACVY